jgi:hypothetical protein
VGGSYNRGDKTEPPFSLTVNYDITEVSISAETVEKPLLKIDFSA